MALVPIPPGLARLARTMPCFIRREIIAKTCAIDMAKFGMAAWEGQYRDTPPAESPRWTTDTPPPVPQPIPVTTLYGIMPSYAGSLNILGTAYLAPSAVTLSGGSFQAVEFKSTRALTIIGLSATMAAALAAGHTINFRYTIGGVDSAAIVVSLTTGGIEGMASGSIAVPPNTGITIKAVQSGGGGDNLQSLAMVYQ